MSGFSADWLALREPLDLAARNREVESAFFEVLPSGPLRLLDLASGAGSTVSALATQLDGRAAWSLTDYDPDLLKVAQQRWPDGVTTRQVDLQADLEQLPFAAVDGITTSAFLDLASETFLERLVDEVTRSQKPFLASLSYDGRSDFEPIHSADTDLLSALNRHQQSDKGFGPALGPEAASRAIALFRAKGYKVVEGLSDWHIGAKDRDFLMEFLSGWVRVGREVNLDDQMLDGWWRDRQDKIQNGGLKMSVGHIDFAAFP